VGLGEVIVIEHGAGEKAPVRTINQENPKKEMEQ